MNDKKIKSIVNYLLYCYEDMTISEIKKALKRLMNLGVTTIGGYDLTIDFINNIKSVKFGV